MDSHVIPYVISLGATKPKHITLLPSVPLPLLFSQSQEPGSRYKTRQLQIQVVGKNKMMRTVLSNIIDVSKDMLVPPEYLITFLGYCVGAKSAYDPKKPERDQAHISGSHEPNKLSKFVTLFIQHVLLCPQCILPEINYIIAKDDVRGRCRSCGTESTLFTDPNPIYSKFKKYIINHHKTAVTTKKKKKEENYTLVQDEIPDDDEIVWYSDTSTEAAKKRAEEMIPELAKKKQMTEELKTMISPDTIQLKELQRKHHTSDAEIVQVIFSIITQMVSDLTDLCGYEELLKPFTSLEAQTCLLRQIEQYCGKENMDQLSKAPLLLKALYDANILEEDTILAWAKKPSSSASLVYRETIKPFLTWLQEAEEESE